MLCQNCGKNEANVKYTQIINGVKKQMSLCDECAKELGIDDMDFDMPISFSNFFGDIFDDYENSYVHNLIDSRKLICDNCQMTYDEFLNTGKFGCEHCYDAFETKINSLLKNIQGSNKHIGKIGNVEEQHVKIDKEKVIKKENENKIIELQNKLKQEIKEERYEDAAKTRDEIKKLTDNK